jgi:hypothetical protein
MSWTDWSLLGIFIVGCLFFLYGANTYDPVVGYTGIYVSMGTMVAYLIIYIYKEFIKKPVSSAPLPLETNQNP